MVMVHVLSVNIKILMKLINEKKELNENLESICA